MQIVRSQELTLIDEGGCLSDEVLCFVEELHDDQRSVVERHIRHCPVCAHQQAELTRAARQVRQIRPQTPLSADVRLLSRQAVLRLILQHDSERERYAVRGTRATWRRRLTLLGLAITLSLVAVAIGLLIWA
ncbi:MAG: hypothetical protein JRH20_10820 [Deltaproteobacteria bacterium]|nr:hypothetical protein [Deltaproteobacteria bacterium]